MAFKIGKPTRSPELPRRSEYSELRQRVATLADGEWLPVECETVQEARRIQMAFLGKKHGGRVKARLRQNTVYLQPRRETDNG